MEQGEGGMWWMQEGVGVSDNVHEGCAAVLWGVDECEKVEGCTRELNKE